MEIRAEKKNWINHVEWVVMLFTVVGGFYVLDGKIERLTTSQSSRTDRLYEMFCDLQKQMKDELFMMKNELLEMKKEQYEIMNQKK